jgi:hypothetical protein
MVFTSLVLLAVVGPFASPMREPVPFTTVARGQQSAVEERREVVVRTAAEWKALWKEHSPDEPLPKVDFEKSIVVGVFTGMRPTGGYAVEITAIDRDGEGLVVSWRETKPAADAMLSQMLTFPFHLVSTGRVAGKVDFKAPTAANR